MKILFLTPTFPPIHGGIGIHVSELSKRLARKHEISIASVYLEGIPKLDFAEFIPLTKVPSNYYYGFRVFEHVLKSANRLSSILESKKFDLVHSHSAYFDLFVGLGKQKNVITLHNSFIFDFYEFIIRKKKLRLNYLDEIMNRMFSKIYLSKFNFKIFVSDFLRRMYDCRRDYTIIPNGVDSRVFRPLTPSRIIEKFKLDQSKKHILFVGRLCREKGIYYLVESFKLLSEKVKEVNLIMIGDGKEYVNLLNFIKKLNLRERILIIRDFIPTPELVEFFNFCDFLVLPSLYEPFGLVIIESLACEKPVIATSTGGIPEILNEDVGILVPVNSKCLADKMMFLLENEDVCKKMGKRGRRLIEEKYDWGVIASQTERFYEKIVEEPSIVPSGSRTSEFEEKYQLL